METGSELAWDAQGKLYAIDEDEYPDDVKALLDQCRESVEDLTVDDGLERAGELFELSTQVLELTGDVIISEGLCVGDQHAAT